METAGKAPLEPQLWGLLQKSLITKLLLLLALVLFSMNGKHVRTAPGAAGSGQERMGLRPPAQAVENHIDGNSLFY